MNELRLATISLCANDQCEQNEAQAMALCRQAAAMSADWILLPEMFYYHGSYDRLSKIAQPMHGELFQKFSELARELNVVIFAGSWPEQVGSQKKVANVSYVFGRQGELLGRYAKTHLFNLTGPDGTPLYRESDGYVAGDDLVCLEIDEWRVGLSICYDLRFPGFYQKMIESKPVDLVTVPSAFTLETGKDHWQILLQARAIEMQSYVFAANQVGEHRPGKRSYGHSMVIDPWGCKITDTADATGIALAVASKDRLAAVRQRLPALANRRPELY